MPSLASCSVLYMPRLFLKLHFPREVFFFGFGLPVAAAFSVAAFLVFFAGISYPPFVRLAFTRSERPSADGHVAPDDVPSDPVPRLPRQ